MSLRTICSIVMCLFFSIHSARALDKVISGQVRDDKNKTMQSVKVELWTKDGTVSMVARTNARGEFSFTHEPCEECFLEVAAPRKSGLASALVDGIPGDEGRSVIVTLKKGYPVTGRVVAEGKGLKGIVVKAYSANHEKDLKARIYGGGAVETGRGGNFEMTLTPGEKRFVILNNRYKMLAKHADIEAKVITDTELGDIEIPGR
ncbi:MAG: carboxypeptidase-like regulatory domain-containing protein [Candidatus Obscuribacterales bacterium]|nr:carboxypeptidase-like regulatory domain-containing protein [Candidatus Obscuribacterales bacterium]